VKRLTLTITLAAALILTGPHDLVAGSVGAAGQGGGHGGGGHGGGGHGMSGRSGSGGTSRGGQDAMTMGRPRMIAPTPGHAVPRPGVPGPQGPSHRPGHSPYYGYYGYYGYGGALGYGLGYDPFWDEGFDPYWGYGGYAAPYSYAPPALESGAIRLEIRPTSAQVYVDGYYAGTVDEYDGHFHHLDLPAGPHHVEVRALGYQPLTIDVNIHAHQTMDYKGVMVAG
jgi:PEGA domain